MSTASVRLSETQALVFEALPPSKREPTARVLLTLEGKQPGYCENLALIPIDRIPAVVASLQLAAKQASC